jgi:hypothetical protein
LPKIVNRFRFRSRKTRLNRTDPNHSNTTVDHWRYPYWDWALLDADTQLQVLVVPELMRIPRVQIQSPDGSVQTIDNPLYRYAFPLNKEQTIDGIDDVKGKDFRIPVRPDHFNPMMLLTDSLFIYPVFANAFYCTPSCKVRSHNPILGKRDMGTRHQQ